MLSSTAITECTTKSCEAFDSKINTWAEGILLTIDADGSKLTIRGAKRPYASEYAKMLRTIHEKTETMSQGDRARRATEIRNESKGALETAHGKETDPDCDITFHLPGKDSKLVIVDETPFYNRETKTMAVASAHTASMTDKECKAVHELKDLKVGECVVVGYDGGLLANDAYVVIKANRCFTK